VLRDGVVSYSIDGTLLWEGPLPSNFDRVRFGLASIVDTGMTQVVESLEITILDNEPTDDEIIEPESVIEADGWQSVSDKTVKYGDLALTAENPKGYIEDGKFINKA